MLAWTWKHFHEPLLPIVGAYDLAPFLIMMTLLTAGAVCMRWLGGHRRQWLRRATQVLATLAFVIGLHPCACLVRDLVRGALVINVDNLKAFQLMMLIVPVAGFGLLWGRVFCGWVCPIGFVQEIATKSTSWMRKPAFRQRTRPIRFAMGTSLLIGTVVAYLFIRPSNEPLLQGYSAAFLIALSVLVVLSVADARWEVKLRPIRYLCLALFFVATVLDIYLQAAFCVLFTNDIRNIAWLLFGGVLAASLILSQAWCRFLCPEGALLSLLTRVSGWKIRLDQGKCSSCNVCNEVCPVEAIDVGKVNASSCLYCCKCVDHCPTDALAMKGEPESREAIARLPVMSGAGR